MNLFTGTHGYNKSNISKPSFMTKHSKYGIVSEAKKLFKTTHFVSEDLRLEFGRHF